MALKCKSVEFLDFPLAYHDDETFFELGLARKVPVLQLADGNLLTDADEILLRIDELFPNEPYLFDGVIDEPAWQALLQWRQKVDVVLTRLLTPALLAYEDISENQQTIDDFKSVADSKFKMSTEELANDRYAAYDQLSRMTNLPQLAKHLSKSRFYMGQLSIADIVLTADLFALQLLDGISLPIDLLYYFSRVEEACQVDLKEGLIINF